MFQRTWGGGGGIFTRIGGVLIAVTVVLEAEAGFQFPLDCEAGISGPHSGGNMYN